MKSKQQVTMDLHDKVEKENDLSEVTPLVVASVSVSADLRSELDHKEAASCGEIALLPPIRSRKKKKKQKQQISVDSHERVETENDFAEGTSLVVDSKSVLADPKADLDDEKAQLCGEAGALPSVKKIKSKKKKENGLSEVTPLLVDSVSVSADLRSELDHKEAASCGEIALLPPIRSRKKKKKQKQQITVDSHERVEAENDFAEGTSLVVDSKSVLADPRADLDDEKAQLCGEAGALPSVKKIKSKKKKENGLSEVTPLVVDSVSVLADLRSELDHKEAASCGEIALLPPIRSRKKKKQKQQITVDSHERVEMENDFAEGTSLVVDSKSVLADPRADLDDEKAQLCGEAGALPSVKKIKSKKKKPKKQITTAVNPAEETSTPVDQDLHVNMEKMIQKQNITEAVNPDARNLSAVDPISDLQDNVSRKKKKKNRKREEEHNSANLVSPDTSNSNMSTVAPTSVLQGLNGNIGSSDESKGLMLSKDDCLMHSSNLVSPDGSSLPAVVPTSDSQENVSGKKRKRKRKQGQDSTNLVNPDISDMSTEAPTSDLQGLNGNIGPSDESKCLMLSKDDCLMHSSNLVSRDGSGMPGVVPTSDLQEDVSGKKKKRKRKQGQNSTNLVNPEISDMSTALNGPSDESKGLMQSKDDCLMHPSNLVNLEASNIPSIAPTSDLEENVSRKKSKRKKRGQDSANLDNSETSNMSTVGTTPVLQGLNGNVDPTDESKSLMLSKDDCLMHSSNLVIAEASNMPGVVPTSDLHESVKGKKSKRKKRGQNSTYLVNPEVSDLSIAATTSVLQGLNGNIGPSDESKGLMQSKDDCLMPSSNLVNPEGSSMPSIAPTSDLQENASGKKSKRKKRGQNSANLVNPEISNMSTVASTSVMQGLNGNIDPSDESKSLMLSKDDCLMDSSNLVIPEANMPGVASASDLQEKVSGKKHKRKKREQNSANLANPETSNMSTIATTSVLQGLNGNIDPSDESKSLMLFKDDCLMHSSNLVIPEANMPGVAPTSDLQEKVRGKKRKRKKQEQNSANLVSPETSNMSTVATPVLQGLNGNIDASDESISLVLPKDDCLMHSSNLVIPEASNMSGVAPTSDLQENISGKKRKRNSKQGQHSANLVNPETCSMASVAPPPVLQGFNENTGPSDESKCLMNDTVTKKDMPQHVPNSTSQISNAKVLNKKLLILDLNGLLADVVPCPNKIRKHDFVLSKKYVFKRPYADEFIDFCLERFTVAVWSSRMKKNIDPLVNSLFGTDRRRKLLFCWDQSHCTKTNFKTIDGSVKKPLVLKDIQKVWDNSFKEPKWERYNASNTLLLDDSPYKALINPANTTIFPHTYSYTQDDDNAIGPGGELQIYLEGLALADNVQEYVRNNPYGQSAITESHPSWNFYKKVKDSYGGRQFVDPLKEMRSLPTEQRQNRLRSALLRASRPVIKFPIANAAKEGV